MPDFVEVTLGRLPFRAPVRNSREQTLRAAELVNARLREIEGQTSRVDDLMFALLTALTFAEDLEEERAAIDEQRQQFEDERRKDTKDFLVALDELSGQVNGILTDLGQPRDLA